MRFVGLVVRPQPRRHRALRGASPPVLHNAAVAVAAAATRVVADTGNCAADAEASLPGCAGHDC